jgi:type I restriction enzyme R subunit
MNQTPEEETGEVIDGMLGRSGWAVQDFKTANLQDGSGVAIRNFSLKPGHGFADYLLYVEGRAAGIIEAKKKGSTTLSFRSQTLYDRGRRSITSAHKLS